MEIPSTITKLPEGSMAFVFGSALDGSCSGDFDLLIVYDASLCPPDSAYLAHAPFSVSLQLEIGLPVDMTLLTSEEEQSLRFVEKTGALPVEKYVFRSLHRADIIQPKEETDNG